MAKSEKWTETYVRLLKAGKARVLEPEELETLALAAYLTGRDTEGFQNLEEAHQGYLERDKTEQAVRSAYWLGLMLLNAGQRARGGGWITRCESLLKEAGEPRCAERGLLMIPKGLGALSAGKSGRAQELFEQATGIGKDFRDPDLIALGRLGQGQARIQGGDVAGGIKLLDETMVALDTGKVFPFVMGLVYCAVIETCRKVWDLRRAQEWTTALNRWCKAHPDIIPFRGQCLVRRAEILQFYGDWSEALQEASDASTLLSRPPGEPAAGEAFYRQAELLRLQGELDAAEVCYHETAKWGRTPQPGLALLRLDQGQDEAAASSIRNSLQETNNSLQRAALLPEFVRIMIAVLQTGEARQATTELSGLANDLDAPYIHACSLHCQGALFLAEGESRLALEPLHKAFTIWNTLYLPYESAQTRVLKGLVYRELKDKDNSDAEWAAAYWIFQQLGAAPDMERVNRLLTRGQQYETYGLTLRERQILQQVATGKTNKIIAGDLFISERTVDRHVSNIFNKLGVASRVAATSFAIRNKIL